MTSPTSPTKAACRFPELHSWTLFCFFIFALKVLFFAVDPLPKFVMGDSGSYIWSALIGWIPPDRSYFYGYVIRWTSFWTGSLTSLLLFQLFASCITSILAALISRFIFKLPLRWSYVIGLLCAIDPLQLLWERYVMTETISLCLYAFVVYHSLLYLRDHRLRDLALVQGFSVLLIGFRISFLLLVEINTVILPLIAFFPAALPGFQRRATQGTSRWLVLRLCGGHLLTSVLLMLALHTGYKRANGWVSKREPAYLYATGATVLAFWAPVLQPEDATDPRLADLIARGDEYGLRNPALRNGHRFSPDGLLDRWAKIEPEPSKADRIARRTALRTLWRDPLGVLGLPWRTYTDYWSIAAIKQFAKRDFSFHNAPHADLIALLATRFHLAHNNSTAKSLLQRYYVVAWPYYFLVLLAPLLAGWAILLKAGRPYAVLLFVHISIMMGMSMTFGSETLRFLQPISFMTLLVIALGAREVIRRRRKDKPSPETKCIEIEPKPGLAADAIMLTQPGVIRS